jgi:hypothetical protein
MRPATGSARYFLNLIGNQTAAKDKNLEKEDAYSLINDWFGYQEPPKVTICSLHSNDAIQVVLLSPCHASHRVIIYRSKEFN